MKDVSKIIHFCQIILNLPYISNDNFSWLSAKNIYMKKFIIFLLLILSVTTVVSFRPTQRIYASTETSTEIEEYVGEVPHFFTHQLISDVEKAFAPNNCLKNYYNRDLLTNQEFKLFLEEMDKNNYTLIDINDYLTFTEDGTPKINPVSIYKGRKPFLLSFDDMSFDSIGNGLNDKIILDENGDLATITTSNGETIISKENESICILEEFIKTHPLFSYNNARAVICPTGYNGILGYRTNKDSYKNRDEEIDECMKIVKKLSDLNYHFACHTYNHINVRYASIYELRKDLTKYKNEVISLINATNIFCFPCGYKTLDENKISLLNSFGYNTFFCVDLNSDYLVENKSIFLKRMVIDRHTIRENKNEYLKYFDVNKIIYY